MEWKDISGLLEKATRLVRNDYITKKTVADLIGEKLNVEIKTSEISLKNKIAYIKAPPLIKGELFLRKKEILDILGQNPIIKIDDLK